MANPQAIAAFEMESALYHHVRNAHTKKPLNCTLCGVQFSLEYNPRSHLNSDHAGKKPYKCSICEGYFDVQSELICHLSSAHEGKKHSKFKFKYVSAGAVAKIIKGLKNSSATGIDKIPTAAWKLGVEILSGPVAKLINLSLSSGKVPKLFKSAIIHPVYKNGGKDPRSPSAY